MVDPAATRPTTHDERLWFGPAGWVGVAGFGLVGVIALYPVSPAAGVVGGVVTLAVALVLAARWATRVRVADGELWAGRAHLPLALVGEVVALDAEMTRAELGPRLDARAHVCLRAWARTAVRVEVVDPQDPTPYWIVSTRHPERLATALATGRDRAGGPGRGRPAARDERSRGHRP
ncbi:DUF3093 domain-containing protein [Cellulomonas sp. ATA003]|uniref:DUF3093 domain-containing protein n=1 Tax=Cellulomonas sp. ATA003 TaxID=3073064 RepID=UPI00287325ED|nr:DUF3093 domain-containing protein [Cellulomonas sp. ATA003]WNB84438.1 DUF3093 domain-containing protein [Cellulomonas sp. ATA003]